MKKILMFIMETCPHCKNARKYMEELYEEHPEYRQLEIEVIDETKEPELANQYDYYYVPTYYVDGKKIHEGVPTRERIAEVFRTAYMR
ncbi:MAG: thioredoxin family protein [Caldicoprobacterales bacterium]|jgi:thioredoxin 1|nr:glutaredoxin [Clostridiales bacterium]